MTTITFREPPIQWIFVDVENVPETQQGKILEALGELQGAGERGLLPDGRTLFTTVNAAQNTRKAIETHLKKALDRLGLSTVTMVFSSAWSLVVELRPFVLETSSQGALEEKLKRLDSSIKEVEWLPDNSELILWTDRRPSPKLRTEAKRLLS